MQQGKSWGGEEDGKGEDEERASKKEAIQMLCTFVPSRSLDDVLELH